MRAIGILTIAALLAACGSSNVDDNAASTTKQSATSEPPTTETTAAPTSSEAPSTNERGNVPKQIGEVGGISSEGRGGVLDVLSFTFDSIEVGRECSSSQAVAPENGQFIFVTMTLTGGDKLEVPGISLNPNGFYIVDTTTGARDSNSITAATYGCVDYTERLPDQVTRNTTVTGLVILDTAVPSGSGAIVWSPDGSGTGWEITY